MTTVKTNPIFTKKKIKIVDCNWTDLMRHSDATIKLGWGGVGLLAPHLINTESKTFVFNRVENRWLKSPKLKIHKTYSPTKLFFLPYVWALFIMKEYTPIRIELFHHWIKDISLKKLYTDLYRTFHLGKRNPKSHQQSTVSPFLKEKKRTFLRDWRI